MYKKWMIGFHECWLHTRNYVKNLIYITYLTFITNARERLLLYFANKETEAYES